VEFVRDVFENSDEHLHLPIEAKNEALLHAPVLTKEELFVVLDSDADEDYKDACLATYSASRTPPPANSRLLVTVGHLENHLVEVEIKKQQYIIELPEVEVWKNPVSYITRMKQAEPGKVKLELLRCLAYCYRYGMPTGLVVTEAMKHGLKWQEIERIKDKARKNATKVTTIDVPLREWFEQAVVYCNSLTQVDVLVWIYKEAATYTTMQPVICKSRLAGQVGCDRKVVRRLVDRLEKVGILQQAPETMKTYDHAAGLPLSNPRILNLDPRQPGRWWFMETVPGPDRSIERKTEKQRKLAVLANNGYWRG